MIQTLVSNYRAQDIYSIDPQFYKNHNTKTLIIDVDNAFERYSLDKPSGRALSLVEEIKSLGITVVLITEQGGKKISDYAHQLQVSLIIAPKRKRVSRIKDFIETNELVLDEIILLGASKKMDMDIALKLNIESIWTDYIFTSQSIYSKFKQKIENKALKRAQKGNLEGIMIPSRRTEVEYV